MKKLLPLLLIFCLLLTSCVKIEGSAKDASNSSSVQDGAKETSALDNPADAAQGAQAEPFALYPAYLQLPLGQHVTLDADSAPAGKKLVWSSSNPSVATVDESGRVTPVAEGEAVITAALADNADVTATCGVRVAAEGSIYLWEYVPEPIDESASAAETEAAP